MTAAKYTYAVEVEDEQARWFPIVEGERRDFCLGFYCGRQGVAPPRLALRVTRSDGMVIDTTAGAPRVALGMVAGFPTPEQYDRAADAARATAAILREQATKRAARRAQP